ncbi:hypothetical protein AUI06_12585 [archaeon 13_2_20CM_2_52_21]|nr:MAG: hypothetical protein AUI06_12585 [archaeon 13_2_20CM_2_52_21]
MEDTGREVRGRQIVEKGTEIERLDEGRYRVASQSGTGFYSVLYAHDSWKCSCPDHLNRTVKCKHIWAVEFSVSLRKAVQATRIEAVKIEPVIVSACRFCGSENIVRDGIRHNKAGDIQLYSCRDCGRYFSLNLGFEKMKASPQAITGAMQLCFTGESLRNVQKFLRLQGVNVSHVAVYKWIRKYVRLMEKYLDRITPKVSDTWRADEILVKFRGNMKYVFALMDNETRFWIAHEVADSKYIHDARTLLRNGKELAGQRPMTLIADGMAGYEDAFRKEYRTMKGPRSKHIRNITLAGERNNNKMERMNGEIRDREKIMRGLKIPETPILPGYRIYHNFLRPHLGLNGLTPAEACGISIQGPNKWLTLIQNAKKAQYPTTVNGLTRPTKT